MDVCILIPAYNPGEQLTRLILALHRLGFEHLVIVDDGSDPGCQVVFSQAARYATVLRHGINLGKGRALKTGFNHCLTHYRQLAGVVTVDADGQHSPEDVHAIARQLTHRRQDMVMGARSFDRSIPWKSYLGNVVMRRLFQLLVGRTLTDTQSGLRAVPMPLLPAMLRLGGEKYDYEMNMLLFLKRSGIGITEIPIRTIYIEDNRGSHFRPVRDSWVIFLLPLRFAFSSIASSVVDTLLFYLLITSGTSIQGSVALARLFSSIVNFCLNKEFVFRDKRRFLMLLAKYYGLVCLVGICSYLMLIFLHRGFHLNLLLAKIVSETILFVLSFVVQRDVIFQRRPR